MGGDDLASDDEYLFDTVVNASSGHGTDIFSNDDEDSISEGDGQYTKKRPGKATVENAEELGLTSSKKRRKKNIVTSSKDILLHAGRGIAMDNVDAQSKFLGTLFSHSIKLSEGADQGGKENLIEEKND